MPEPNQEKSDEKREHRDVLCQRWSGDLFHSRHHQRIVDIRLEPAGQRHVPAAPVDQQILRRERPVEVLRQNNSEEPCHPDHHVHVAGKVEV